MRATMISLAFAVGTGPVMQAAAQSIDRNVMGWRFGLTTGVVHVHGDFEGTSPTLSTGVTVDYIGSSGWSFGVGTDLGAYDPAGDAFHLHTIRLSPRYSHIGQGAQFYQFFGIDAVGSSYHADRSTVPLRGGATASGFGLGPSIGAGGLVGSRGLAMELTLSYTVVGFGDAKTGGTPLPGTAARAHVFRLVIGFWFG